MDESLPYRVCYSAGKEKCENCRHRIRKSYVQIAIMVQSNTDDCQYPKWYDQQCFFKCRLPPTEAAIDGFSLLRYEHQLAIKKDLGIDNIEIESQVAPVDKTVVPDFSVKYTKVVRDSCQGCTQQFKMDELRIMRFVSDVNNNQNDDLQSGEAHWYHIACFVRLRSEIGWLCSGDLLPGFKRLAEDDKKMIQNQIPVIKLDNRPIHNTSEENTAALEKEIRSQNELYFKVYDYVVENVTKDEQIEILNFNEQMVPSTDEQIVHHLTDVICFGALDKCKSCTDGHLLFRNWIYKCTNGTAWTMCGNEDKEPARFLLKIPQKFNNKHLFLIRHCEVQKRALHSFKLVDEQGNDLVYGKYKKPPLFNMEFILVGKLKKPRADVERLIKKLGGKVGTEVHDRVAAIISTEKEVQRMGKQIKEARRQNIQVVAEAYLDEIQRPFADPIFYIMIDKISDWGGDPKTRIEQNDVATRRKNTYYTKLLPKKMTYKWKDGGAVDPESDLEEKATVFFVDIEKKKLFYSVILGFVDIHNNKNSYYRMQLLESNDQNSYWVFQSWGRIGTVIGSKCLKKFGSLNKALDKFNSVYEDKTGNKFGTMTFQKQPKKFYRLDVEVGMPREIPHNFVATKLDEPVYDLMKMLFDVGKMENIMCSCDLDLKQMPLGKISAKQIKKAMSALCTIGKLIHENDATVHELREASNRFYTYIPHTFGVKRPPIIDSIKTVRVKNEMLESLLNMQTIYSFLEGEDGGKTNPFDACYSKMNATIVPIAKDSDEFQQLCDIVKNTHGPTHNHYTLEVLEIFKVERAGENERFQNELPNHRLLWHGSRLMNYASILSKGLKVAPPEAIVTGYNFGKGIYFADVVSKSAHYCFTDKNNDTGLLLMCKVALGNSMHLPHPSDVRNIPNAAHQSVKGIGHYFPVQHTYINGIPAPFAGIAASTTPSAIYYNEFVAYDPNQVKIEFLLKVKFHFKK